MTGADFDPYDFIDDEWAEVIFRVGATLPGGGKGEAIAGTYRGVKVPTRSKAPGKMKAAAQRLRMAAAADKLREGRT